MSYAKSDIAIVLSTPENPPNQIFRIQERPHLSGWEAGVEPGPPDYGRQNASGFLSVLLLLLLLLLLLRKSRVKSSFSGMAHRARSRLACLGVIDDARQNMMFFKFVGSLAVAHTGTLGLQFFKSDLNDVRCVSNLAETFW